MTEPFHLVTLWAFDAPIERVWALLNQTERFPEWWPGFEAAEKVAGRDGEIGTVTRYRVRGDLGLVFNFTLRVVERRPPEYLKLIAEGDFVGTGEWQLRPEGASTSVTYIWDVDVQLPWARLLSRLPGARHRLEESHDRVMRAGGINLARLLADEGGGAPT